MQNNSLDTCLQMIDCYDSRLSYHCRRTAEIAGSLAMIKGYDEKICSLIYTAGCIHDIGKIVMPPEVLNKSGKLTREERKMIDLHAYQGYRILRNLRFEKDICEIVLFHHGFNKPRFASVPEPRKEIVEYAKIMKVADAFDALTSERSYSKQMSSKKAIEIMLEDQTFSKENIQMLNNREIKQHFI